MPQHGKRVRPAGGCRPRSVQQCLVVRSRFEPDLLRLGRLFDEQVKQRYPQGAHDVQLRTQVALARGSGRARWSDDGTKQEPADALLGRRGYVDLLLTGMDTETSLPFHVVAEVKNTDWTRITPNRVRRNVNRHRLQLWSYLEPLLDHVDAGAASWAQGALVYPSRPRHAQESLIDDALDGWGSQPFITTRSPRGVRGPPQSPMPPASGAEFGRSAGRDSRVRDESGRWDRFSASLESRTRVSAPREN